jgi:hypothetical protein
MSVCPCNVDVSGCRPLVSEMPMCKINGVTYLEHAKTHQKRKYTNIMSYVGLEPMTVLHNRA